MAYDSIKLVAGSKLHINELGMDVYVRSTNYDTEHDRMVVDCVRYPWEVGGPMKAYIYPWEVDGTTNAFVYPWEQEKYSETSKADTGYRYPWLTDY